MRFAVIGVGYTGQRVLSLLPAAEAVGCSRSRPDAIAGRQVLALDLDRPGLDFRQQAANLVLLYTVPPADTSLDDSRLANFLDALQSTPAKIVYLSTSGVYGDRAGALVAEDAAPDPTTDRAKRRLAAEQMLLAYGREQGGQIIILRIPGIYGPGRLGMDRIRSGLATIRENEAHPGNRIHVDDLAACCVAAMTADRPAGVYNVADGDYRSNTWFLKTVASMARLEAPPEITRTEAQRQFSAKRLSFLMESRRLDTTKMRDVLGFTPRYTDAAEGIQASLIEDGLFRG